MEVTLLSSALRYVVIFEPDPQNKHMPTPPRIVETPYIRDLTEVPEGVRYIYFGYVVESTIRIGDYTKTVVTKPFNKSSRYLVYHFPDASPKNPEVSLEIPVHPSLGKRFRVFGDEKQLLAQALEKA